MPRPKIRRSSPKLPDAVDVSSAALQPLPRVSRKLIYLIIAVLALAALLYVNKSLLVAALVDGKPIFRWELNSVMASRFGKQTLEGMISELLIRDAARKAGVAVSQEEIDGKTRDILASVGDGLKLEDFLAYQGMTKSDFEQQIRLQLTVQKVLGKDIVIAERDIDAYIATNRATLVATQEAALRSEARNAIIDSKVGERLQPWFMELKQKAKILRFL